MRPSIIIAKAATRAAWPVTRLDRNGHLSGPVVLCYHRVLPRNSSSRLPAYAVTPEQFRDQMALLTREGFISLTLDEFRQAASGERELAARSILITFDDGFADNYLLAWPIARECGIKLNLFLWTGLVTGEAVEAQLAIADQENKSNHPHLWKPLTWSQVREMSAMGVGAGFHSHRHRNVARLGREELAADTAKGISLFASELGVRPKCFAFPYGHYGSYSDAAISVLREQGIEIFFTTEMGLASAKSANPIPRIVIHPEDDLQSFRRKLYGGYNWVGSLRRFGYSFAASLRNDSAMSHE